jgi:hypothetical protein
MNQVGYVTIVCILPRIILLPLKNQDKKMTTKSFPEYTREEMLECLTECYTALVDIYRLTAGADIKKEAGPHHDEVIFNIANEPLDKMFNRISSEKPTAHK